VAGTACNDGIASTGNDVYNASCVCAGQLIDCLGVAGGSAIIGSACNDGNAATGNDVYNASCVCAGQLIDCLGVPGGTAIIGSACNDGNAATGNDIYNASCVCAGQLIDCLGVAGGTAIIGSACNDGIASTGNDVYNASCVCAGQLIDCLGVPGGTSIIGSPCNDGIATTVNDVFDAGCICAGTSFTADCLGVINGTATVGTACDDGIASTTSDTWNADCICIGTTETCTTDAGSDQTTCGTTVDLSASDSGSGSWSGPVTVVFVDINSPTTAISCSVPGVYDLTWTVSSPLCTATDVVSITFQTNIDPAFNYAQSAYCQSEASPMPWVASSNGSFTSSTGLILDAGTGVIDAAASDPGFYTITHVFNGACPTSAQQTITVLTAFDPSWNLPAVVCSNSEPIELNSLVTGDAGGSWSGPGVAGTQFDPAGLLTPAELTYTVGSAPCISSLSRTVGVQNAPIANAGPDAALCGFQHTLDASLTSGNGVWSVPSGTTVGPSTNDPTGILSTNVPGTYTLVWTVTEAGCAAQDTVTVIFNDPAIGLTVNAGPDQELEVVLSTTLEAVASPGAGLQWTLLAGSGDLSDPNGSSTLVDGLMQGTNTFVVTASLGNCVGASDTVNVNVIDLFIPQGFSPNGDGDNDRFEVTGMAAYPGSELVVFNRWGQKVFETGSYANEWDGHSKNGQELPNDTYFYVLNLSGEHAYNGFVVIKR